MVVLTVNEKKEHNEYTIQDVKTKQIHKLYLYFLKVPELNVGDIIKLNEKLLDKNYEGYLTHYTFGDLKSQYGRDITSKTDNDIMYVKTLDGVRVLKRLYG